MKIELTTTVKQSTNQVSCNLNGEVAILNLNSTLYFGLEEVGAYIWQAMEKPAKVSDLCQQVLEHFDVGEEECQADILKLVQRLDDAGLIETMPHGTGDRD
jgi:Coenzyme PQQ synthesis protein D (PqqD)